MVGPIILVDDNPENLGILRLILEFEGFSSMHAFSDPIVAFKEAIRMNTPPALVITDFSMPRLNGGQLLDALEQAYPGLQGIVVTSDPVQARRSVGNYPVLDKNSPDFAKRITDFVRGIQ